MDICKPRSTGQILFASLISVIPALVGCGPNYTLPTAPTPRVPSGVHTALAPLLSVQVSPAVDTMRIGETMSFTFKVELGEGVPPSLGGFPLWSSDNPDVITIDASGNATAIRRGNATIEVIARGVKGMRMIQVTS
jgi:hypothetical protein